MIVSLFIIIIPIPPSLYSRSLPLYFKRHRGHRVLINRSLDDHESRCSKSTRGDCFRASDLQSSTHTTEQHISTVCHDVASRGKSDSSLPANVDDWSMVGGLVVYRFSLYSSLYSVCRIGRAEKKLIKILNKIRTAYYNFIIGFE